MGIINTDVTTRTNFDRSVSVRDPTLLEETGALRVSGSFMVGCAGGATLRSRAKGGGGNKLGGSSSPKQKKQ